MNLNPLDLNFYVQVGGYFIMKEIGVLVINSRLRLQLLFGSSGRNVVIMSSKESNQISAPSYPGLLIIGRTIALLMAATSETSGSNFDPLKLLIQYLFSPTLLRMWFQKLLVLFS